ncbi:MAG: hypothetical protein WCD70_04255 [Alphaproteobacteria bacterium]
MTMTVPIINCGDASVEAMEAFTSFFEALPSYIHKGLEEHGYQVVVGRFLSSCHAELKGSDRNAGGFAPTLNRMFFAEYFQHETGKINTTLDKNCFPHEAGHFVDLVLAGTGKWPDGYSSDREPFKGAAEQDIECLAKDDYKHVREAAARIFKDDAEKAKYLLSHFKQAFVDNARREREIYAEIFANIFGQNHGAYFPIQPLFPRCAALVQADHARFEKAAQPQRSLTQRVMHHIKKIAPGLP